MKFKKVEEGNVELKVPDVELPEKGRSHGFYNPVMYLDRDLSVAFVKQVEPKLVLDAMSATGMRGIRYAKEAKTQVWLNDVNEKAVELIKKNVEENRVKSNVEKITWDDCNHVMTGNKFDFIDIDPYGSPVWSLDSAVQGLSRKGGYLAVTATDLGALFGRYPKVCLRRYGFKSQKTDYSKEEGARILVTAIVRECAKHDRAFIPLLTYYRRHYLRVYGRVVEKLKEVNRLLEEVKPVTLEKSSWSVGRGQPLYMGKIEDRSFLEKLNKRMDLKLINKLIKESDAPPFYYDVHKVLKGEIPPMDKLVKKYNGTRTHFCGTGIKTESEPQFNVFSKN